MRSFMFALPPPVFGVETGALSPMVELAAHGARTAWLAGHLCERLGVSPSTARAIDRAARVHDIGKRLLPEALINKPTALTSDERVQIERHCVFGAELLTGAPIRSVSDLTEDAVVALLHHEWWNGQGYPYGMAKLEIPRSARIVAVADVFDALVTARTYKPAWPLDRVLGYIWNRSGTQFDPECVEALMALAPLLSQGWKVMTPSRGDVAAVQPRGTIAQCSPPFADASR